MPTLKLSWLGTPRIECGDQTLHMPTRKATALLAFLGEAKQPLSRERLAGIFWAEYDQTRAFANLRRTLVSIHQILGAGALASNRDTIGFNPERLIWMDTASFHRLIADTKAHAHQETLCAACIAQLEDALALYRGDFLEGFSLKDCPEFDDWQQMQAQSFRADLNYILDKLSDAYLLLEEWDKAVRSTRLWVNMDRLHEAAQRRLMLAYARSGQRSAAIHQYEDCKHWLELDLGQLPEAETTLLYERILDGAFEPSGDPNLSPDISSAAGRAPLPLIRTKLFIPRQPVGMVSRRQLIAKLQQGAHRALTLISAPAGYGKTTLLSEWVDILRTGGSSPAWTVCWVSLDAEDNDPVRFLSYLSAALEKARPGFGTDSPEWLHSSGSALSKMPLSILMNDLQDLGGEVLLVLDDYQFISNPAIHDGVSDLLEHLPETVHVVLVTRSDPPFPLARLRARNQLTEIRAHDLRFSSPEISQFLNAGFQLDLSEQQIDALQNRTEGWIAGLQLAAISMQGRYDIDRFIRVFSGSQKFIMDYLTEEALTRLSKETQVFLLQTSILERLSEPLCDFILAQASDPGLTASQPKALTSIFHGGTIGRLAELERANLFIIPLDEERKWYRYHHLFADLLRSRLEQAFPGLVAVLHSRASSWYENHGEIADSIHHALAANDWKNASRLIGLHLSHYLEKGQMTTVMKWIQSFPPQELLRFPMLCVQVAEVYSQAGMIDQITPLLDAAEEAVLRFEPQTDMDGKDPAIPFSSQNVIFIRSMSAILRGLKAVCADDARQAIEITRAARASFPQMDLKELAILSWVQGWAYRSLGDLPSALETLTQATEYARDSGANLRDIWTDLGNVTRLTGKLTQAADIFTRSLQNAASRGIPNQGNLSRDEAFLSFIYFEQNDLAQAFAFANRAIEHTQWWPSHNIIALASVSLAQIYLAWNDVDASLCAIQKADEERHNRLMTPFIHSLVEVTWVRIWLKQADRERLDAWVNRHLALLNPNMDGREKIDEYVEIRLLTLVRVWIEQTRADKNVQRCQDCLGLLEQLENSSQAAGRLNSLVAIRYYRAVALSLLGKTAQALLALEGSFSIAEPGGYMRTFLEMDETGRSLIKEYVQHGNSAHKPYARRVLSAFDRSVPEKTQISGSPETLTAREREVLQLLGKGCSNREIAEKLVLSEGTVKFHVHHLLNKLQVDSRTQAIVRAKELNLIR